MARPVWAEVNLAALAHNVKEIKKILPRQTEMMAVVKANGYGHGAGHIARTALAHGATWLGVATLDEALALRREGIEDTPILILGYTPSKDVDQVVAADISQTVFNIEQAKALNAAAETLGKKARLHLKVDTGMGRLGYLPEQVIELALEMSKLPNVKMEGLFTHFAASDAADKSYSMYQLNLFKQVKSALEQKGIVFDYYHAANSAAIIDLPEAYFNLVRAGIILYGYYPSHEVQKEKIDLKPVMTLKAKVVQLKEVPSGYSISYGCTYRTSKVSRIATLPIGYADGYSRLLSNRAEVLIRGHRAPVVGRVCMDQCMIDVTAIPEAREGDEVVLFGYQGEKSLPIEEVAAWRETISYEVVSQLSGRVPRIYIYS
ncbi:MAG: alanine racemase [Clostridia bacterium]|nr:alanine racemase [Clostridia bacterium]